MNRKEDVPQKEYNFRQATDWNEIYDELGTDDSLVGVDENGKEWHVQELKALINQLRDSSTPLRSSLKDVPNIGGLKQKVKEFFGDDTIPD